MHHRTDDGRAFRILNLSDEFTRESLAIRVRRRLSLSDVIDVLTDLFILRGVPGYIRSDNGPEFVAGAIRRDYNAVRPHSSLGYQPPAPETIVTPSWPPGSVPLRRAASLAEKSSMH